MRKTFADLDRFECWGFRVGDRVKIKVYGKYFGDGYVIAFEPEYDLVVVSRGTWYTRYHKDFLEVAKRDKNFSIRLFREKTLSRRLILTTKKLLRGSGR